MAKTLRLVFWVDNPETKEVIDEKKQIALELSDEMINDLLNPERTVIPPGVELSPADQERLKWAEEAACGKLFREMFMAIGVDLGRRYKPLIQAYLRKDLTDAAHTSP